MLKPQDIVILLKMLAKMTSSSECAEELFFHNKLATHLCISPSEVHAGIKRLTVSQLLGPVKKGGKNNQNKIILLPIKAASEEFLICAVKYFVPAQTGVYTRGIVTSYAAPIFEKHIILGNDPVPVWPHAEGGQRGFAFEPLYRSVPNSLIQYPDQLFYEFLVLIDTIRSGRARERNLAIKMLKERIYAEKRPFKGTIEFGNVGDSCEKTGKA